MGPDQSAIARFRRDMGLAVALKIALIVAVVGAMVSSAFWPQINVSMVVFGALGAWMFLSFRSIRSSRLSAMSPVLIEAGQFDKAEEQIHEALRSFSIFGVMKLTALHHLAMLRHAQHRWNETAALCRALLGRRLGAARGLSGSTRLMLAEAMLELNDLAGAHDAISGLYHQQLHLDDALELLVVQTDYLSRIGAWPRMIDGVGAKLRLIDLLGASRAAQTQGLIALAARHTGHKALEDYLRRRVELLAERDELIALRPMLGELWGK